MSRYQIAIVALLAVATVCSCINLRFPRDTYLQNSATVLGILGLLLLPRWHPLSNAAVTCLGAFLAIHVLGARYIYSYVPYDAWSEVLFRFNPTEFFDFHRNHYDRFAHFCFGGLLILPLWEVSTSWLCMPRRPAYGVALLTVLAFSAFYELFEWLIAITLSPATAEAYNGQQGDVWDPQKDMALALLGGVVGIVSIMAVHRRTGR